MNRLRGADFTGEAVVSSLRQIIANLKRPNSLNHADFQRTRVVLPFFHRFSNPTRTMATKFKVEVVFKNDYRLSRLTLFDGKRAACQKCHRDPVMPCQECIVIYEVPVECGHVYTGQAGQCFYERVPEQKKNKNKVANYLLLRHLEECSNLSPV